MHLRQGRNFILHSLPGILVILYSISLSDIPIDEATLMLEEIKNSDNIQFLVFNIAALIHVFSYLLVILFKLRSIKKSNTIQPKNLMKFSWLYFFIVYLIWGDILVILFYSVVPILMDMNTLLADLVLMPIILWIMYSFLVFYKVYFLKKDQLKVNKSTKSNNNIQHNHHEEKLLETIEEAITTHKIYIDPHMDLIKMADMLDVPRNNLSDLINRKYAMNFSSLINKYRIELLKDETISNYKMEAIGELDGFNSRATFFSVFKKITGLTPSEYKRKLEQDKTSPLQ